jgi:hypothetical protein
MSLVHFPGGPLSGTLAAAFAPGRDRDSSLRGVSVAAATVAVVAFVVASLALSSIVDLMLGSVGLIADSLARIIGYVVVAGVAMVSSRRFTDLFFATYRGRWVVYAFTGIDIALITLATVSKTVAVDYLASIAQMTALCGFAYLQFWKWNGLEPKDGGGPD